MVVDYLYRKFPSATPHELTYLRAKVVCSSTLAYLAITQLDLHKVVLANSMTLWRAMDQYVPILEKLSTEEIVKRSWRYDPPKAISDIFESVIGAVLVDSGYNYDITAAIAGRLMEGVLEELHPKMAENPVGMLQEWCAKRGCKGLVIRSVSSVRLSPFFLSVRCFLLREWRPPLSLSLLIDVWHRKARG